MKQFANVNPKVVEYMGEEFKNRRPQNQNSSDPNHKIIVGQAQIAQPMNKAQQMKMKYGGGAGHAAAEYHNNNGPNTQRPPMELTSNNLNSLARGGHQ